MPLSGVIVDENVQKYRQNTQMGVICGRVAGVINERYR